MPVAILLKTFLAAAVIAGASSLANARPALAGFIMALPLSTLIALAFTQVQFQDAGKTVEFAKSIFLGVPLSLTFFLPFLLADKLKWPFWGLYGAGLGCLVLAYFAHQAFFRA